MWEFLKRLLHSDFMPHGACWGWEPWVVWSNVLSDAVIFACYSIIAVTLINLIRRRKDVPFDWVVVMFGLFTFACGCTHAMEVYNTWHGLFRLAGVIKVVTAAASLMTTLFLLQISPKLMVVPTLDKALAMDAALATETREKHRVQGRLSESEERYRLLAESLEEQMKVRVQEWRESEARLQGFIRHSPAAISFKGLDGRYLMLNPKAEALFGRPLRDIIGRTNEDLFPPENCARARATEQRVLQFGQETQEEHHWVREDGVVFDLLVDKFPLVDATGHCWGLGILATDITERKQADRALLQSQKLESLGVLAGGIAHDFNNLLGAMQGNVELAMTETSLESARPFLETLKGLMAKGSGLLRQLLAYSGRGKSCVRILNLNQLVEEMIHLLGSSISKKARVCLNLHPELPPMEADPAQIQQVVMNLVINASEAMGEQTGTITLSTRTEQIDQAAVCEGQPVRPGLHVSLEVADDGSGMPPEVLKKIFDPFFTTKFTGRGLGLAAIHGIVRGHQGCIQVSSEPGRGSTFKLLFPAAQGQPGPSAPDSPPPRRPAGRIGGGGTVLVVDDEGPMRAVMAMALERAGLRALQARDGLEALSLFQQHRDRIGLIILDLTMPNMDGEETCRELRRNGAAVPVVLSSGFNEAEALRRFEGLGLSGFLQKPFALGELVEWARKLLAG